MPKFDKGKTVYFQGPVKWAKVFEFNMDDGEYAPEGGQYTIDIGLGKKEIKEVLTWNKNYEPKDDEDFKGVQFIKFKRKNRHLSKKGKLIKDWSGPPKVVDADGNPWDEDKLIGNGSICTVKLNVTEGKMFSFVRLEGVRVDEHVAYEPDEDDDDTDEDNENSDDIPF